MSASLPVSGSALLRVCVSLLPVPAMLLVTPLTLPQRLVLGVLIVVILWWVTGLVERTVASLVLLAAFLAFSGARVETVLTFPKSENFWMILAAFLFSQGIANSGLAERLLQPLLARFAKTVGQLLAMMAVSAVLMIFIIPQPFSRVIILVLIFKGYFDKINLSTKVKETVLFALFLFSAFLNMLMLRGDIIMNNALLSMSGVSLAETEWMRYMTLPTAIYFLLAVGLFRFQFRRELAGYVNTEVQPAAGVQLSQRERICLALILLVVVLWALEEVHGVSSLAVAIGGTAVMFPAGLLRLRDLRSVNVRLMVFLTAAFSIGGVLKETGVADIIFSRLVCLFPKEFSLAYAAVTLVISMALHMILGSNVTTMSVVAPGLMAAGAGIAPPVAMMFLIYIGVCGHFLLPFHNVILLLGEGDGCYSSRYMLRFGIPLTGLTLLSGVFLYMGWWQISGLL